MKEGSILKEIPITDIEGFCIGNAQNFEAATGCTVILTGEGALAGMDIRGGGPASRESALLNPLAANDGVHAILLSGGSAFGLDAAGGVMRYLEERDIGFPVGVTKVPIVCASCLFDLRLSGHNVRPDAKMGYDACIDAKENHPGQGNIGAGTGATVGKFCGEKGMMKSGLGLFAVKLGDLKLGAVVAVNALGDVYDYETNRKLAGLLNPETGEFADSEEAFYRAGSGMKDLFAGNTTIGAILTNGKFSKAELTKIAGMAHNGYSRSIRPVHTDADGDSIYAVSTCTVPANLNVAGTLASTVMAEAIKNAVLCAVEAYGLKAAGDFCEF